VPSVPRVSVIFSQLARRDEAPVDAHSCSPNMHPAPGKWLTAYKCPDSIRGG